MDLNEDAGYFTFSSSEESEFEYGDDDPMFDFRDLPEGKFFKTKTKNYFCKTFNNNHTIQKDLLMVRKKKKILD